MKKVNVGWLLIALGMLVLSVELYLLPAIQSLDFLANKSAYTNLSDYIFSEPSGLIAVLLDMAVIIMGITLICKEGKTSNSNNQTDN